MTTEDEIHRLGEDALKPGRSIWVAHFFSHFGVTDQQMRRFLSALFEAGFGTVGEVGVDDEGPGYEKYLHYWAYTRIEASADSCRRLDSLARELAELHGVRYDEWEIARDVKTGTP